MPHKSGKNEEEEDHEQSETSSEKASETVEVSLWWVHKKLGKVLEIFVIIQFIAGAFVFFGGIFLLLWAVMPETSLQAGSYMLLAFYIIGRAILGLVGFYANNFCLLFSYGVLLVGTFVTRTILILVRLKITSGPDDEFVIPPLLQACPGALSTPIELIFSIFEALQAFFAFYMCWIIAKTASIEKNYEESRLMVATELAKYLRQQQQNDKKKINDKTYQELNENNNNNNSDEEWKKMDTTAENASSKSMNDHHNTPNNVRKLSRQLPLKGILHQPSQQHQNNFIGGGGGGSGGQSHNNEHNNAMDHVDYFTQFRKYPRTAQQQQHIQHQQTTSSYRNHTGAVLDYSDSDKELKMENNNAPSNVDQNSNDDDIDQEENLDQLVQEYNNSAQQHQHQHNQHQQATTSMMPGMMMNNHQSSMMPMMQYNHQYGSIEKRPTWHNNNSSTTTPMPTNNGMMLHHDSSSVTNSGNYGNIRRLPQQPYVTTTTACYAPVVQTPMPPPQQPPQPPQLPSAAAVISPNAQMIPRTLSPTPPSEYNYSSPSSLLLYDQGVQMYDMSDYGGSNEILPTYYRQPSIVNTNQNFPKYSSPYPSVQQQSNIMYR